MCLLSKYLTIVIFKTTVSYMMINLAVSFQLSCDLSATFGTVFGTLFKTLASLGPPGCLLPSLSYALTSHSWLHASIPDFWALCLHLYLSLCHLSIFSYLLSSFSVDEPSQSLRSKFLNLYLLRSPDWIIQPLTPWMASGTAHVTSSKCTMDLLYLQCCHTEQSPKYLLPILWQ